MKAAGSERMRPAPKRMAARAKRIAPEAERMVATAGRMATKKRRWSQKKDDGRVGQGMVPERAAKRLEVPGIATAGARKDAAAAPKAAAPDRNGAAGGTTSAAEERKAPEPGRVATRPERIGAWDRAIAPVCAPVGGAAAPIDAMTGRCSPRDGSRTAEQRSGGRWRHRCCRGGIDEPGCVPGPGGGERDARGGGEAGRDQRRRDRTEQDAKRSGEERTAQLKNEMLV